MEKNEFKLDVGNEDALSEEAKEEDEDQTTPVPQDINEIQEEQETQKLAVHQWKAKVARFIAFNVDGGLLQS